MYIHTNWNYFMYLKARPHFFMIGVGEFPVKQEMGILVPPNTLHAIWKVEKEGLLIYNIFSPGTKYTKREQRK